DVGGTVPYAYFANKEALFLAAVDEDAVAVIHEALSGAFDDPDKLDWQDMLLVSLLDAVDRHPLARRLLAGLEPEVTPRVLHVPALEELRKATAERLATDQVAGIVRPDVDPTTMAEGMVAIVMSLPMSVVQLGLDPAGPSAVRAPDHHRGLGAVLVAAGRLLGRRHEGRHERVRVHDRAPDLRHEEGGHEEPPVGQLEDPRRPLPVGAADDDAGPDELVDHRRVGAEAAGVALGDRPVAVGRGGPGARADIDLLL